MSAGYNWLKVAHVLAIIVWLGGSCAITALSALLARADEPAAFRGFLKQASFYGPVAMGSSSLVTLLTGLGLAGMGGMFKTIWVQFGFAAILLHFVVGPVLIRRASMRVEQALSSPQTDAAAVRRAAGSLTLISLVYLLVLFSAAALMVLKP